MRNVLVTGGAGFIGSHLVETLVSRGDRVRVFDNLSTGNRDNLKQVADQLDFEQGDILNGNALDKVMRGIDVVFHQAALASVPLSIERPLEVHAACATGTLTLLDLARRHRVKRVVYAASSSAYGDRPTSPKQEADLPQTLSPYAAAKLAGEYYCQSFYHSYGLETVCLRYFNVFGPRQDPASPYSAVIPLFITALLNGVRPTVFGDGSQSRDFTYVGNVVHGNLLAAERDGVAGKVFNLGDGRATTLLDLLTALKSLLQVDIQPRFEPPRPGDVRESLADISQARDFLGYEPQVDLLDGLRRSIDYYRSLAERSS